MDELRTYTIEIQDGIDEEIINATSPLEVAVCRDSAEPIGLTLTTDQSGLIGLLRHLHSRGIVILSFRSEPDL